MVDLNSVFTTSGSREKVWSSISSIDVAFAKIELNEVATVREINNANYQDMEICYPSRMNISFLPVLLSTISTKQLKVN